MAIYGLTILKMPRHDTTMPLPWGVSLKKLMPANWKFIMKIIPGKAENKNKIILYVTF